MQQALHECSLYLNQRPDSTNASPPCPAADAFSKIVKLLLSRQEMGELEGTVVEEVGR